MQNFKQLKFREDLDLFLPGHQEQDRFEDQARDMVPTSDDLAGIAMFILGIFVPCWYLYEWIAVRKKLVGLLAFNLTLKHFYLFKLILAFVQKNSK